MGSILGSNRGKATAEDVNVVPTVTISDTRH